MGRTCALHFASRGACVVITGRNERALGETIGEIVNGAGKARHLAGDVTNPANRAAMVDKAIASFGRLDIVVAAAANGQGAVETFQSARSKMSAGERFIALLPAGAAGAAIDREVRALGADVVAFEGQESSEEGRERAWEAAALAVVSLAARA